MRINPIKREARGLTGSLPEPFEIFWIKFRILSPPLGGVFLGDGHLPPSSTAPSQGLRESLNFDILHAPKPHRRKSPLGRTATFTVQFVTAWTDRFQATSRHYPKATSGMRINPIKSEAGGFTGSLPEPFEICRTKSRILSPPLGGDRIRDFVRHSLPLVRVAACRPGHRFALVHSVIPANIITRPSRPA